MPYARQTPLPPPPKTTANSGENQPNPPTLGPAERRRSQPVPPRCPPWSSVHTSVTLVVSYTRHPTASTSACVP